MYYYAVLQIAQSEKKYQVVGPARSENEDEESDDKDVNPASTQYKMRRGVLGAASGEEIMRKCGMLKGIIG